MNCTRDLLAQGPCHRGRCQSNAVVESDLSQEDPTLHTPACDRIPTLFESCVNASIAETNGDHTTLQAHGGVAPGIVGVQATEPIRLHGARCGEDCARGRRPA